MKPLNRVKKPNSTNSREDFCKNKKMCKFWYKKISGHSLPTPKPYEVINCNKIYLYLGGSDVC